MVAMAGTLSGSTMLKQMRYSLAPSILADSTSASGNCWKFVRSTIKFQAEATLGKMYTQ